MDGARERLNQLLAGAERGAEWIPGRGTGAGYKRITATEEERARLANIGGRELWAAFGFKPYFSQAVLAGAMLSGDYDRITAVTPFQYGKSALTGRAALLLARRGAPVYVAANTADLTGMIMSNVYSAVRSASEAHKAEIAGDGLKKADKMGATLNRQRIGYTNGGAVEALTLGGTYQDTAHNKALGKGGAYIIDEAALVSDAVYGETLRSLFARTDGGSYLQVAISNPHADGWFYRDLTGDADPRHLVVWMDARTAVHEGRWTAAEILRKSERMSEDDITRYLLCELPREGLSMYPAPEIADTPEGLHFLGVDSAYKGKDDITIAHIINAGGRLHVAEVATIQKTPWIDGVTSVDIVDTVTRVSRTYGAALVCVDVGQGVWLTEGLAARGVPTRGIAFGAGATKARVRANQYAATNASNLRAEMHIDLQDLMEHGGVTFSESAARAVAEVLPRITSTRTPAGKIQIRPKAEIKAEIGRSPDAFDAVLLGIHAAITYNAEL